MGRERSCAFVFAHVPELDELAMRHRAVRGPNVLHDIGRENSCHTIGRMRDLVDAFLSDG